MDNSGISFRSVVIWFALALSACGGGGYSDDGSGVTNAPPPPPPSGIGPAGGTVLGPNGSQVVIPANALTTNTAIAITQTSAGSPALPGGLTTAGLMFAVTPHGTTFAVPVTVTLPFDPAAVPAGKTPALFKTNAQNQWETVANAVFGANTVSAQITSFSFVLPAFTTSLVQREVSFHELRSSDLLDPIVVAGGRLEGSRLAEFHDFGPAKFDAEIALIDGRTIFPDGLASGAVNSAEDGTTFSVSSEAPLGNFSVPDVPVGSKTTLIQLQSFVKRLDNATLTLTLPQVFIDAHDENAVLGRKCPEDHVLGEHCFLISGFLHLHLEAMTHNFEFNELRNFYELSGGVYLHGFAENWTVQVFNDVWSRGPLWNRDEFDLVEETFNRATSAHAVLTRNSERPFAIDLSSIPVGATFHVRVTAQTESLNLIGGPPSEFPTSVGAYMREGLTTGGAMVEFSGLDTIDASEELVSPDPNDPNDPVYVLPPPVPCVPGPGPNPAAGTLQFSASSYAMLETSNLPTITVTRTGGATGVVSASFTTSDGTATGDTDYLPLTTTVFFADGDAEPRIVSLPILQDLSVEPDETVNLTLSQPGGCTALGTQDTAVLTILDDEAQPPGPSGLDPTFDTDGKATLEAFGGDRSAMAVQPDGKVVMVGGTFTDFVMARFNANGSADDNFGDDGKVTTNMITGEQEEALGVAIQPDNKIVVVGYTGRNSVVALARYLPNGTLDNSFGVEGKAITSVVGRAFAVALQPDNKIVIAGDVPSTEDFLIARFNANGGSDFSFANGGLTTDINVGSDSATNIVLQPNGFIVVSGPHTNFGETTRNLHTGLLRMDPNGVLDNSFDGDGRLLLTNRSVGEGLALQRDGKLVLAGRVNVAVPPLLRNEFALMRLRVDGTPDGTFGAGGLVITQISTLGDEALAVALQADDKIIAAGRSRSQVNSNFAVARYDSAGVLDPSFAAGGKLEIDFFGFTDIAESVVVDSQGKIILGGLARNNVDGYGVARVTP